MSNLKPFRKDYKNIWQSNRLPLAPFSMFMSLNGIELVFIETNTGISDVLFLLSLPLACIQLFCDHGVVSKIFVMSGLLTGFLILFRSSLIDEHTLCIFSVIVEVFLLLKNWIVKWQLQKKIISKLPFTPTSPPQCCLTLYWETNCSLSGATGQMRQSRHNVTPNIIR